MDVLTDVLRTAQLGRAHAVRTLGRAPWALAFERSGGAHFHVVVQGSCTVVAGDRDEVFHLAAGDVILLPRGAAHVLADEPTSNPVRFDSVTTCTSPDDVIPLLEVGGTGTETTLLCGAHLLDAAVRPHPLLSALPEVVVLSGDRDAGPQFHTVVDLLAAELRDPRPGGAAIISALVDALLAYLLRAWHAGQPAPVVGWGALTDPSIGPVVTRMHEQPDHPWTVANLAAHAGLSRAAFSRRFADLMGEPPLTYLTRWRMIRARGLLISSDAPLSAVARAVGYQSPFAFARAFKRHMGESPGRFRSGSSSGADPAGMADLELADLDAEWEEWAEL